MSFYWPESKHISQDSEVFELDGATERHAYERVKVEQMTDTISFVAVAREAKRRRFYECGTWFVIRPAHDSREFSIFAEERRYSTAGSPQGHIVDFMEFASNNSFLTQFRGAREKKDKLRKPVNEAVVFGLNGEIKTQDRIDPDILRSTILGHSDLHWKD